MTEIRERPVQSYSVVFGFGAEGQGFVAEADVQLTFGFLVVERKRPHLCKHGRKRVLNKNSQQKMSKAVRPIQPLAKHGYLIFS